MLTGKKEIYDKEIGFESGVDDYLTKPFSMKELMLRVGALIRRQTSSLEHLNIKDGNEIQLGHLLDGKYLLEEKIGQGGMGLIFRAKQVGLDREVVVKIMHSHLGQDPSSFMRFKQEQKLLAKINHPNVVAAYDVGLLGDKTPYIVMEYVNGESLYSLVDRRGPLSIQVAANILTAVCRGLHYVHGQNIVHRDLKPENILILCDTERVDWVKVVDFGTAIFTAAANRITSPDMFIGTPEFMAPEQLKDLNVDGRADIYALGVVLFFMLSGNLPFNASTPEALLIKTLLEPHEPLSNFVKEIPTGSSIEKIVDKALEKDPAQRYQSADELRLALEPLLG